MHSYPSVITVIRVGASQPELEPVGESDLRSMAGGTKGACRKLRHKVQKCLCLPAFTLCSPGEVRSRHRAVGSARGQFTRRQSRSLFAATASPRSPGWCAALYRKERKAPTCGTFFISSVVDKTTVKLTLKHVGKGCLEFKKLRIWIALRSSLCGRLRISPLMEAKPLETILPQWHVRSAPAEAD